MSGIVILLLREEFVDARLSLHATNIYGVPTFIGCVVVLQLRKYSSTMVVFTKLNIGRRNF